jgi:hypothetical protein
MCGTGSRASADRGAELLAVIDWQGARAEVSRPRGACEQLRQLGDIRRNPPRLVFGEHLSCGSSAGLFWPPLSVTTKQASNSSTIQGGGKRRVGILLAIADSRRAGCGRSYF